MAAEFLINVKSKWDSSSVRAYEAEVKKAIANIKAAAQSAARAGVGGAGAATPTAETRRHVLGEQARMEANLSTLRKDTKAGTSGIDQAKYAEMVRDQRAGMRLAAQAAGVDLLVGKERVKAANEVLREAKKSGAAAADATRAAAQETSRDRARARANQTKTGSSSDDAEEKRLRADERKAQADRNKAAKEAQRQAKHDEQERARIRLGLPEFDPNLTARERQRELAPHLTRERIAAGTPQAKRGAEEGRVQWGRDVLSNQDGMLDEVKESTRLLARINAIRRRIRESEAQQARLSREAVILSAKELVSRASFKGNVSEEVGQHPVAVEALAKARIQARTLAEQIGRSAESQADEARRGGNAVALANQQKKIEGAVLKKTVAAEEDARVWETIAGDSRAQSAFSQQQRAKASARAGGAEKLADLEDRARNRRDVSPDLTALKTEHTRQVKAQAKISTANEKQAAAAQKAAEQAAQQAARASKPASLYQRFEARVGRGNQPASERPTAGQTLGAGVLSAARFGAGAALLYGGINTVKQMVTEASELERVFALVESQFQATGKAAQFPGFREELIQISKETGEMATKVAFVGFQFEGAFGDKPGGATFVLQQTRDAIEIARISGLDLNEVVDSLTSASISFGTSIAAVSDKALGIQARFGVQSKETLQFFGDISSVAAEAGLSLDQLGAIAGAAQQATGRSGAALAEGLGRIIPGIQEASVSLVRFYKQTPALAGKAPELAAAAGAGQTGAVLERLIRDYGSLDAAQRKQIITLLGGRREAQVLIPILENSAKVVRELDGAYSGLIDDTGKTDEAFSKLKESLSQKLAELQRSFEAFGQELFEAGLGDLLKDLAVGGEALVKVISAMASAMSFINRETHGVTVKILELIVAIKLLRALGLLGVGGFGLKQGIRSIGAEAGSEAAALGSASRIRAGRAAFGASRAAGGGLRAGANAGLAGAGLTVGALGVTAAAVVGTEYFKVRGNVQSEANKLSDQIKKADSRILQDIAKDKTDFWTTVAIRGSGKELPAEMAAKELRIRAGAGNRNELTAAKDAGLLKALEGRFKGLDQKSIDELLKADAKGSDGSSGPAVQRVLDLLRQEPGGQAALDAAVQKLAANAATATAASRVASGEVFQSLQAAKAAFEAGAISSTEYLATMDRELSAYRDTLTNAGKLTEDQAAKFAAGQRQQAEFISGKARELVDYNLGLAELSGNGGAEASIAALTALLQDKTVTDPKVRLKAANDLVAAEKSIQDVQLAAAETAADRLRILQEGFKVPDESRIAILEEAISNVDTGFRALVDAGAFAFGNAANLITLIATGAVTLGITSMEAYKKLLREKMAYLLALSSSGRPGQFESDERDLNEEYNRLKTVLDSLPKGPGTTVPGAKGKASPEDIATATRNKKKEAEADAKAAADEAKANAEARFALMRAEAAGDPVKLAEIAISQASDMAARAKTTAEVLNAKAAMVEAQRGLIDARAQVADSYANIDKALAAANGDIVRVAEIEYDQIKRNLESARARGDDMAARALQADLIAADARKVDARVQAGTDETDFLLEMEQISNQQAIAMYKSFLNLIPPDMVQKRRELLLKIRQLEKGASEDFNFNIPSEIKLPTLYEVRRLRQTQAAGSSYGVGSSYQDNRQIMVQYNVMTAQDNQAALDDLLAVTSGQPRVGASPRGY